METNYSKHAAVWDWDGYNRSEEFDFWCRMGDKYGKNVLSAMGALGQAGAYMAEKGYQQIFAISIWQKKIMIFALSVRVICIYWME